MKASVLLCIVLAAAHAGAQEQAAPAAQGSACAGFLHGVASGDPRPDSVIIWTRFTPGNTSGSVPVTWHMSTDPGGGTSAERLQGTSTASRDDDFTVRVQVSGLQPSTRYYYHFTAGNFSSLQGTTKTAPAAGANATLRFAQMSCASWRWGFFNVYDMASRVRDLDFVVFLGDWVYEYGNDQYPPAGQGVQGRAPLQPPTELASLADYRTGHRLFRTDAALLELMRRVPIIAVWDDHDVAADNAYKNGTANPVDGVTYANRRCHGVKAYIEYMPITTPGQPGRSSNSSSATQGAAAGANSTAGAICGGLADIYRTFTFGRTMTLVMLEQRVTARDEQYNYSTSPYIQALQEHAPEEWDSLPDLQQKRQAYYAALEAPNRTLIGTQQMSQLRNDFRASQQAGTTWQVLGNTVVMGPLNTPDVESAAQRQGPVAETLLQGILSAATSDLLELAPGVGATARVLVGTGRYHDPVITDGWSGYQHERNQVLDILQQDAENPVVLSGDIHNAFVWRLFRDTASTPVAIEFTTASVTSPGLDLLAERISGQVPVPLPGDPLQRVLDLAETGLHISNNRSLHYSNIRQRGAIIHTVSPSLWHADFSFVDTKEQPNSNFGCQAAFQLTPGAARQLRNATCTPRSQLFLALYSSGDPLNGSTSNLSSPSVPGTQLSSCSVQPTAGQGSGGGNGGSAGNGGLLGQIPVVGQLVSSGATPSVNLPPAAQGLLVYVVAAMTLALMVAMY